MNTEDQGYIFSAKSIPTPRLKIEFSVSFFSRASKIILLSSAGGGGRGGQAVFVFKNINPYGKNLNNIYLPYRSSILLEFL